MEEFIEAVKPQISLIGVGENNTFGHPNDEVIKRLENIGSKVYRTDKMGEISIKVNSKGKIQIKVTIHSLYKSQNINNLLKRMRSNLA